MQTRKLGRTGIEVGEIGFGSWGIGGGWGPTDDAAAIDALNRAIDLGVTFIDTAMGYGDGHSERLIAQAVRGRRERVVIATKISPKTKRWPVLPSEKVADTFPADWVVACTEQSLKNLGTDYLDVQQLHAWTPPFTRQLEWHEALEKLRKQGKVRALGVSANDWDPYGPIGLVEAGLIDTVQVIYNIFEQRPAQQLLPAAVKHNVGIIVRVPFEEGLLTGRMGPGHAFAAGDWRKEWLTPDRLEEAARRADALKRFLNPDLPTLPGLALKFCLSHPAVSTVIPGMRSPAHVEANVAVSDGKVLSTNDLTDLRRHEFVHGWAYPWAQK